LSIVVFLTQFGTRSQLFGNPIRYTYCCGYIPICTQKVVVTVHV